MVGVSDVLSNLLLFDSAKAKKSRRVDHQSRGSFGFGVSPSESRAQNYLRISQLIRQANGSVGGFTSEISGSPELAELPKQCWKEVISYRLNSKGIEVPFLEKSIDKVL